MLSAIFGINEIQFKNGFTLVEILVVMVLLAMAGSLVFVSVGKTMAGNRNRAFAASCYRSAKRPDGQPWMRRAVSLHISSAKALLVGDNKKSLEIPEKMLIEGEGIIS